MPLPEPRLARNFTMQRPSRYTSLVSAARHWIGLDEAFTRLLPDSAASHARLRFAQRAAALTDIHAARVREAFGGTEDSSLTRHVRELQQTHHALTAALAQAWNGDRRKEMEQEQPPET